jgi:hypothetical protein
MLHIDEDRCLDLLHDLLEPDTVEAIIAHLETCSACEELLRQRAGEREKIRARHPLQSATVIVSMPPSRSRRSFWLVPAVAAALALGVGITTWSMREMRRSGQSVPAPGWLPPARDAVVTREPTAPPTDAMMQQGLDAYERRDYEAAARFLARATAEGEMEIVRRLYWSSALAWKADYKAALGVLRDVRLDPLPEPWRGEALWTRYVALQGTSQFAAADSLLRNLTSRDDAIGERARAVVSRPQPAPR